MAIYLPDSFETQVYLDPSPKTVTSTKFLFSLLLSCFYSSFGDSEPLANATSKLNRVLLGNIPDHAAHTITLLG